MKTITLSEFRKDIKRYFDAVNKNVETLIIHRGKDDGIVIMSLATIDLQVGGKFVATMASKDGSMSFDFIGIYDEIEEHKRILYHTTDDRVVEVLFEATEEGTRVTETFDAENMNPVDMQQAGWQAILNNFKAYAEK
jgi:uncharacterized protein YndB with AHSA1/START domain